jgi:hypothetical protein
MASVQTDGSGTRGVVVLLVFLILGPPLGAFELVAAPIVLTEGLANLRLPHSAASFIHGASFFFSPLVYVFGGVQALLVGLVAGTCQMRSPARPVPLLPVLTAAAVTYGGFLLLDYYRASQLPEPEIVLLFLSIHLGAALGCWLIANLLLWPFRRGARAVMP